MHAQTSRGPAFPFRRTKRQQAAESILSSIRRRYATFVDVASYAGLGLVLYAGTIMLLSSYSYIYAHHCVITLSVP